MAVRRVPDYPNVLLVGGESIYGSSGDYRERLRDHLHRLGRRESPVRKGTHDFWITYPYPSLAGHGENFSHTDMDVEPRPLRGIIEMTEVPTRQLPHDYTPQLAKEMHVMLQEVGHHWLVPGSLRFRSGDTTVTAPGTAALVRRINAGAFPDGPILLGRTDNHWSVFTETQGSPMDGQSYTVGPDRDGLSTWAATRLEHTEISVTGDDGGAGPFRMLSAFNDLELYLMGVLGPREVYANETPAGGVHYLEPRVTAEYDYLVGLFVRYDDGYDTFGFHRRPDSLAALGFDGQREELALGSDYRPFTSSGVVLRVVRRGDDVYFQAKADTPYTDLEHESVHGLFDDLRTLPERTTRGGFDRFRTVAHWSRRETPRAIGLIVRRWSPACLVEGRFYDMGLKYGDETGSQAWKLTSTPRVVRSFPNLHRAPVEMLYHHKPSGSLSRVARNRLFLTAPHSVADSRGDDGFRHFEAFDVGSDDRAPKYFVVPRAGDFTFGSSVRVSRVLPTPWAGGDIQNRTMWGVAKRVDGRTLRLPSGWAAKRTLPDGGAYRCAFILVADDTANVPDDAVRDLDVVRRYFTRAWYEATRRQRRVNSRL